MNAIRTDVIATVVMCLLSSGVLGAGTGTDSANTGFGSLDPKTGFYKKVVYDKEADVLKKIYSDSDGNVVYVLEFKDITSGKRYREVIDEKTGKPKIIAYEPGGPAKPEIHSTTKDVDPSTGETVVTYYDAKGDKIGGFRFKSRVGSERNKKAKEYSLPEPFKGVWIDPHRGDYIIFAGDKIEHNGIESTCTWLHAALSSGDRKPSTFETMLNANKAPGKPSLASGAAGRFSVGENLAFAEATILTVHQDRISICYTTKKDRKIFIPEFDRAQPYADREDLQGRLWFAGRNAFKLNADKTFGDHAGKTIGRYEFSFNDDRVNGIIIECDGTSETFEVYHSDGYLLLLGASPFSGVYETTASRYEERPIVNTSDVAGEDIFKYIKDRDIDSLLSVISGVDNWNSHRNGYGFSPFVEMIKQKKCDRELIKYCMSRGADPFEKLPNDMSGLSWAVANADLRTVALIVYSNPGANWQASLGRQAVRIADIDLLKLFLPLGLNVHANYEGLTLLRYNNMYGSADSIRLLTQYGANR